MSLAWESVLPFTPTGGPWPPPTFAASRQRRDLIIAQPPEGVSKEGGPQPSLFGRFKGKKFLRKGGNRNPPFLKPFFGYFLSGKKVTRRRHKGRKSHRAGQSPAPTHVYRKPMRHTCGAMHPKGTCFASLHCVGIAPYENAKCPCVIRAGGQSRPPLQSSTIPAPCPYPVIPSQ